MHLRRYLTSMELSSLNKSGYQGGADERKA